MKNNKEDLEELVLLLLNHDLFEIVVSRCLKTQIVILCPKINLSPTFPWTKVHYYYKSKNRKMSITPKWKDLGLSTLVLYVIWFKTTGTFWLVKTFIPYWKTYITTHMTCTWFYLGNCGQRTFIIQFHKKLPPTFIFCTLFHFYCQLLSCQGISFLWKYKRTFSTNFMIRNVSMRTTLLLYTKLTRVTSKTLQQILQLQR